MAKMFFNKILDIILTKRDEKLLEEYSKWSKNAEWKDGVLKTSFIHNRWKIYIKEFYKTRS